MVKLTEAQKNVLSMLKFGGYVSLYPNGNVCNFIRKDGFVAKYLSIKAFEAIQRKGLVDVTDTIGRGKTAIINDAGRAALNS